MGLIKSIKHHIEKYKVEPKSITIDITNRCNAECPFCSRQVADFKRDGIMKKDMFYEIMEQVERIPSITNVILAAFGEPMLHPDFDEFVNYIDSKGKYTIGFPTNMSLAEHHFDSMLKASRILMSIEGWDKESYEKYRKNLNFEKTYSNVVAFDKLIRQKRDGGGHTPQRELNFLLTKDSQVDKYINLWAEYTDMFHIGPLLPALLWDKTLDKAVLKTNKEYDRCIIPCNEHLDKMFCAQPFSSIIVRPDGNLALCCSDYDFNLDFGNYKDLKNNFFNNKNYKKVRNEFKKKKLDICKNCFQNFIVKQEDLVKYLPELEKYTKIRIFSNR